MSGSSSQIADYFLVVGLPDQPKKFKEYHVPESPSKLHSGTVKDPITDIAIIFKELGDPVPNGFECVEFTPRGFSANLNSGSFRSTEVFLCFKRGRDKPPIQDMGVMFEGSQLKINGAAVFQTPTGRIANINNQSSPCLYVTYSRAPPDATPDTLFVTDIVVINASEGEEAPHTFCKIDQKLNNGLTGSKMHICYRKSRLRDHVLSFEPEVLSRYPLDDTSAAYPLDPNIPMFCLPLGASVEAWPASARDPQPVFSSFVLTQETQDKYYGCVITFYEPYPVEKLSSEQRSRLQLLREVPPSDQLKRIVASKAICLLSEHAYFAELRQFLEFVYKLAMYSPSSTRPPIERFVAHLLHEVPVPSAERTRVLAQISPSLSLLLSRPDELPLPSTCASFTQLLCDLGVDKTLDVFVYALLEQPILIHSVRPHILTLACEAVKAMIFPFIWSFPYIPFCPLSLSHNTEIPMGFIIGIDTSFFERLDEIPRGIICVDLDTGHVLLPDDKKHMSGRLLPKKPMALLKERLERVYKVSQRLSSSLWNERVELTDAAETNKQRNTALELECREAFLAFMASVLRGYRQFLIVPTNVKTKTHLDAKALFRIHDFVRSRDKVMWRFFDAVDLENSQNFAKFVEELTFSARPHVFDFFDDCCQKVEMMAAGTSGSSSQRRLLETSRSDIDNERTVVIPPPSSVNFDELDAIENGECKIDSEKSFPLLDHSQLDSVVHRRPKPQRGISNTASNNSDADGLTVSNHVNGGESNDDCDHHNQEVDGMVYAGGDNSKNMANFGKQQRRTHQRRHHHHFDWSVIKRTRQEAKSSHEQVLARASNSYAWAKIIEAQCYAVWFCVLPAFFRVVTARKKLLTYAVSRACNWARFADSLGSDQVPYRVIFALAATYRHPATAVHLLMRIRKLKFEPNAATLVICNRVLYTSWQSHTESRPVQLWRLLRDVWSAAMAFRAAAARRHKSRSQLSLATSSVNSFDKPIQQQQQQQQFLSLHQQQVMITTPLIYSPKPLAPTAFKFPPETPLDGNGGRDRDSTIRARTSGSDEQEQQANEGPSASVQSPMSAPPPPPQSSSSSSSYASSAQKMLSMLGKVASQAASGPVAAAGFRLVESSALGSHRGSRDSLSMSHNAGQAVATPPAISVESPSQIQARSTAADQFNDSTPDVSYQANHSGGVGGGKFSSLLKRLVSHSPSSSLNTQQMRQASTPLATPVSPPLSMKESRSTPHFGSTVSSAQRHLSSGLASMRSKLVTSMNSAVQQLAAATSTVPDDSLIDLHTSASMPLSNSIANMSSASVYQQQQQVATSDDQGSVSNYATGDVVSICSQVTSDSATNESSVAAVAAAAAVRTSNNLAAFHQNSISSASSRKLSKPLSARTSRQDPEQQQQLEAVTTTTTGTTGSNNNYNSEPAAVAELDHQVEGDGGTYEELDFWPLLPPKDEADIHVVICGANKCPQCHQVLFEEDVMAMWAASDSVFNAVCPICGAKFIPQLEIYIKDYRDQPGEEQWDDDELQLLQRRLRRSNSEMLLKWSASELSPYDVGDWDLLGNVEVARLRRCRRVVGPIHCIFLSPLALRKEIEQASERSSAHFASDGIFVDEHATLYWNLMFVNARMMLHSHLPSLVVFSQHLANREKQSKGAPSPAELRAAARLVCVSVTWDNVAAYNINERPLYWHWSSSVRRECPGADALIDLRPFSRRLMTKLVTLVRRADMLGAIKLVLMVRRRDLPEQRFLRRQSMYRTLLHLSMVALGRYNIDVRAFDRAYVTTFEQIKHASALHMAQMRAEGKKPLSMEIRAFDQPPSDAAIYCRRADMHADVFADFDQKLPIAVAGGRMSSATAQQQWSSSNGHQWNH